MSLDPNTQTTDASRPATKLGGLLRPLLLGLVLAGIVWAVWQFDLPRYMSVAGMRALMDAHAPYGPLVFMAIVVAGLFTRVPMMGTVLVAVGAVLFGRLAAFAYGWPRPSSARRPSFSLYARWLATMCSARWTPAPRGCGRSTSVSPATASGPSSCCGSSLASRRCLIGGSA